MGCSGNLRGRDVAWITASIGPMYYNVYMNINEAILDWKSKKRRMGCVAASDWLCSKVQGFRPSRLTRYTSSGEIFEHVVATDGLIVVDLVPHLDSPD